MNQVPSQRTAGTTRTAERQENGEERLQGPVLADLDSGAKEMLHPRMTFGKHKGQRPEDVPTDYLLWCLRECDCLDHWLREAIRQELAPRCGRYDQPA